MNRRESRAGFIVRLVAIVFGVLLVAGTVYFMLRYQTDGVPSPEWFNVIATIIPAMFLVTKAFAVGNRVFQIRSVQRGGEG